MVPKVSILMGQSFCSQPAVLVLVNFIVETYPTSGVHEINLCLQS